MKTAEQMAAIILETVQGYGHTSFIEIINHCGDEARGSKVLSLLKRPNFIYWADVSETFANAFALVRHMFDEHPSTKMLYLMDGGYLKMPIPSDRQLKSAAKPGCDFKKPMWVPVNFTIKNEFKDAVFPPVVVPVVVDHKEAL
jgi:hypothetical protein